MRAKIRSQQAWELRLAGHQITDIARKLGVSIPTASRDVSYAYEEYRRHMTEDAKEAARLDLLRLDALAAAYWKPAQGGDAKAAQILLKILQQREKIYGYAAPEKVEITTPPDTNAARQQLEQILQARGAACEPTRN